MQFSSIFVESRRAVRNLVQLGMLLLGCCLATFGQEATIVGTATHPSGSAVPNVTITVTHTGTGETRALATNDAGQYVAPDLVIGNYDVNAEAPGFKTPEKKNIVLNVNDRTRIDFVMQVGAVQESVTVEANAVACNRTQVT
jgi:hypothetical protein